MSFSREFRYRNLGVVYEDRRGLRPGWFILGGIGVLLVCCICVGLLIGVRLSGVPIPNPLSSAFAGATPTTDKTAPVPLKSKGLGENGLELTVTSFQRPLKVEGQTQVPPDQQFILVSVLLHSTRSSSAPIKVSPGDFKVKGDGGLAYDANPKIVTIENLMMPQDSVGPGKDLERELIFQIAKDDSGLKLYWAAGKTPRVFLLEPLQ